MWFQYLFYITSKEHRLWGLWIKPLFCPSTYSYGTWGLRCLCAFICPVGKMQSTSLGCLESLMFTYQMFSQAHGRVSKMNLYCYPSCYSYCPLEAFEQDELNIVSVMHMETPVLRTHWQRIQTGCLHFVFFAPRNLMLNNSVSVEIPDFFFYLKSQEFLLLWKNYSIWKQASSVHSSWGRTAAALVRRTAFLFQLFHVWSSSLSLLSADILWAVQFLTFGTRVSTWFVQDMNTLQMGQLTFIQ